MALCTNVTTKLALTSCYPQSIYYVGGFGSEHYIGYIPLDMYQVALPADQVAIGGRLLVTQN